MKMSRLTRRLTISSLLGITALGMVVIPASVSQAAPTTRAAVIVTSASSPTPRVQVTIKGHAGTFSPTAVTATSATFTTCTKKKVDLVIHNKSKAAHTITYNGSAFVALPAHSSADVCEYGPAGYVFVYGIQGSSSTLSVTMS